MGAVPLDELILQTLSGNATPSVGEQVRRWRAESPANEAHYQGIVLVWSATVPEAPAEAAAPSDPRAVVAEAERRRAAEVRAGRRAALPRILAIAAGIAALAVSVRLLTVDRAAPQPGATYVADTAAPRTIALDDGSFVRLAAGSRIEVRIADTLRTVDLSGRAFFAVGHDPARPFVVRAGAAETRVLGTRFEVAETDDAVRTIVVDGLVAMSNARGEVDVPAGSVAHASGDREPTVERPANVRALLDWPGGLLLFQDTPLSGVAEEVGSFFSRSVAVEGDSLRALRISGSFEQESFEEVVQALCEAAGAGCRVTTEGAVIAPTEPRHPGR